ncbi:hypothetical protein TASIC1_0013010300 [Trichoderma asperellum]|uniref:Uncharacterized protein n=1 Tax=Trichoderma asperellum TaxID=101201 RepID=A0A6V8R301_TRIAP|nr:hypothetical protein TASIC1_0013010300 [Trichoderma asperellum]
MRVSPRLSLSTQESGNGDGHNHAMPQRSRRREAAHLTSLLYNLHLMLMHRKRSPTAPALFFRLPPLSHAHLAVSTCFTAVLFSSNSLSQLDSYHRDSTARQPPDPVPVRRGSGPPMPMCDGLMSESFDPGGPIAVKRQQAFCQWLRGLGGGTTSRLPELDALPNCCLCGFALFSCWAHV